LNIDRFMIQIQNSVKIVESKVCSIFLASQRKKVKQASWLTCGAEADDSPTTSIKQKARYYSSLESYYLHYIRHCDCEGTTYGHYV